MNLGQEQPNSDCCKSEPAMPKTEIRYPELRIQNQLELVEGLSLGQTFQALITCKVTNIEAHTEDALYMGNEEGSSLTLNVTDLEVVAEKPTKPKGAIAIFSEITK